MSGRTAGPGSTFWRLVGAAAVTFAVALFAIPLFALLAMASPVEVVEAATETTVTDALGLSLLSSLAATMLSAALGLPLAWVLARRNFPGRRLVRALVTLPLVLPPVVGGAALLFAFGRRGLLGGPIDDLTGLALPFSFWGVVVANTFVAMPFLVLTVEGALSNLDPTAEDAAATLGARPRQILRTVTLPMIRPALTAGLVLTWARALGEFGATVTFAGSLPGRTRTLPLAVAVALEGDREAAVAASLVLVGIAFVVVVTVGVPVANRLRDGSPTHRSS